jgi:hypothetical protein
MSPNHLGIQEFFQQFNKDRMDLVEQFYDADIHFMDPMVDFTNRDQLKRYYEKLYQNVDAIRFDFSSEVKEGDTHMAAWTMTLTAKKFNGGRPVVVAGVSHVRFGGKEGKAVYHRDYFDMGAFVYEHVPLLSGLIGLVKKIMSGQH